MIHQVLISSLIVILVSGLCENSNATVFGDDSKRKQVTTAENPILMRVGRTFQGTDGGGGTVWLAGECEVAVMYHTAFYKSRDQATGRIITARGKIGAELEVFIGLQTGAPDKPENFKYRLKGKVVEFGNYLSNDTTGTFRDYAILKLEEKDCVGRELGYFNVKMTATKYEAPTGPLTLIGFHQDRFRQNGVTFETGCKARDQSAGVGGYSVDCSVMPMCSGCPVLEKQSNGELLVVGMMKAGSMVHASRYHPDLANWMVMADVFSEDLLKVRGMDVPAHLARAREPQSVPGQSAAKVANAAQAVVR